MKSLTVAQQQKLINMVSELTLWLWNMNDYDSREVEKYRDWETDRKSTRLNSSHSAKSRMPSSA